MMNTLDIFVEKGRREGRKKTARNLIMISNLTDEQIATATDLPIDGIISIRKEVKMQPE